LLASHTITEVPTPSELEKAIDPVADLETAVLDAAAELAGENRRPDGARLSRPPKAEFGDYSSNAPMLLAPLLKEPPRAVAEKLGERVTERLGADLHKAEVAGPGFLNLFMSDAWFRRALAATNAAGDDYGRGAPSQPERVQVEFVSANPTGPANAATGRHAAYGDSLGRILSFAGHQGEYVIELANQIDGAADADLDELARRGVELTIEEVRATLERYRVSFDRFFHERELHESGMVEKAIELLREHGHVYESEGATWLRTSALGDEKDRVLKRSDGEPTYFASDIQLVNLLEGGQRFQSSKRSGNFVSLDDLIDDIGVDAARFFMLQRSHDTTLDLDLKLARDQSQENPVYYVQYAHARIASILRKAGEERVAEALAADLGAAAGSDAVHPSASALLKQLLELPEEVRLAAERRAPHRFTAYSLEVARSFSAFYRDCKVVGGEDEDFRIALALQAKRVIARSLDLLGVEAPESM
jgi:arginyl-tRNA synthetase